MCNQKNFYHFASPCSAVCRMEFQIVSGTGKVPSSFLLMAVIMDRSPGIRIFPPESLTAAITDALFLSKSSTNASGLIAINVCPQFFVDFLDSTSPNTADPLIAPARISTQSDNPAPLCPPKVAIAPPSSASFASVVSLPSLPNATPTGSISPLALAESTPKRAMALVAISNTNGCGWDGTPIANGFVPKTGFPPAAAATNSGLLAAATATTPRLAIRST
mmetsp:Transcript_14461/g.31796  ORF Transcript_14461/g.31796 Transcript_14461/m.31796 type:complete len:220 (+) Transcript_14461:230-889(+)